ncbi:MAG: fasciclin domain-containing protein [Stigonema ocellatum SAG 48.90 = DSM 106950]|nr:fasciclin domain-containing protein [Stigonema ocellatum SAG 48.90 = DSM 106950]
MRKQNLNPLMTNHWFKKLAFLVGMTVFATLSSFPVLAKIYPRYALFQPSAYSSSPYRTSDKNIADVLTQDKKYTNLVYELKQAGLLEKLKQPGQQFTIFAPTDSAFNALPKDTFKQFSQPENRIKVLQYHLVAGKVSRETLNQGAVTTLEGHQVKISENSEGTVLLNDADGKYPSTLAKNGVIIEINKVLLPPGF